MSDIYMLEDTDPEWSKAWGHFPDPAMWNDIYKESLQYMGTIANTAYSGKPGECHYYHEFRHRAVPGSNERRYWKVAASLDWNPESTTAIAH